ncbi:MAG: DNA polymerase III subunit beta [Sphingomonadaceae bacterium]|nr:DNA polymerase III subunit beta [Sphingomonadaceae bacterium]
MFSAQINVSALKTALNTVRSAISPRAANEINKCVRLEVGPAGLVITATSGLIAIEAHAECEAYGDEAIVVPHDKLAMVCGLYDGVLSLQFNANRRRLVVKAGKSEHTLACLDSADWPPIAWEPEGAGLALVAEGTAWARGFAVANHASQDENRYGLNGVNVERIGDEGLRCVATDGSRLAWADVECTLPIGAIAIPGKQLVPVEVARALVRSAAGGGSWGLRLGQRSAAWGQVDADGQPVNGAGRMWFRLVEGEFPQYQMVLPASYKRTVKLEGAALSRALKAVCLTANDKNNSVRAAFEASRILLTTQDSRDTSGVKVEVDADLVGTPLSTGFNASFLADALALLGNPAQIVVSLGDVLDPVLLTAGAPAAKTVETAEAVVVMPMRLD